MSEVTHHVELFEKNKTQAKNTPFPALKKVSDWHLGQLTNTGGIA